MQRHRDFLPPLRFDCGTEDELVEDNRTLHRALEHEGISHVYEEFGPDGRQVVDGHPVIEPALAELARATGEARYLELAKIFVDRRGHGTLDGGEIGLS